MRITNHWINKMEIFLHETSWNQKRRTYSNGKFSQKFLKSLKSLEWDFESGESKSPTVRSFNE